MPGSNITFPSKQDTADLLEIIQNSQQGDHVAFASLYDKYTPCSEWRNVKNGKLWYTCGARLPAGHL